jgi:uncharacterized repeat protein (TIGR01451 family)
MPGTTITYTIAYRNSGTTALSNLKIVDATPPFTTYGTAACGTLPAGLTCSVTAQPAVGATGPVEWRFVGPLAAGANGSVTISVVIQ